MEDRRLVHDHRGDVRVVGDSGGDMVDSPIDNPSIPHIIIAFIFGVFVGLTIGYMVGVWQ